MPKRAYKLSKQQVTHLWLKRQGLLNCERPRRLTKQAFQKHLETTGGLQVDSVNVLDRAHYLTLWTRFGNYKRPLVDKWVYGDRIAYEYWGHEASILPASHLRLSLSRMSRFPPDRWKNASYWTRYQTSAASKRRVMKLIREHGPLESQDFEPTSADRGRKELLGWGSVIPKEDKRSLGLLWHAGKLGISSREKFRKKFDLAERVYDPAVESATTQEYFNSWLDVGLSGNGIVSESHLQNYFTAPALDASERRSVIDRNLKNKKIVEVEVEGLNEKFFTTPEHFESALQKLEPVGTTFICPFDSLLWQRKRAEDLLGFKYRIEIYVPESKRKFGYYVLPILHDGKLVGRFDSKLHRKDSRLEVKVLHLESWFKSNRVFDGNLREKFRDFAKFLGAEKLDVPKKSDWRFGSAEK